MNYYYWKTESCISYHISYQAGFVSMELAVPLYGFINHHTDSMYSNIHSNPKQLILSQNMTRSLNTIYPDQANIVKYC